MKYLQLLNWTALFAGAAMTVVLAVVCLMLWVHRPDAAAVGSRLAPVVAATVAFGIFGAAAGASVWSVRAGKGWWWAAEAALVVAGFGLVQFVRQLG